MSLEEKIAEMERKISVFAEKLTEYDRYHADIEKLGWSIAKVVSMYDALDEKDKNLESAIKSMLASDAKVATDQQKKADKTDETLRLLDCAISRNREEVLNHKEEIKNQFAGVHKLIEQYVLSTPKIEQMVALAHELDHYVDKDEKEKAKIESTHKGLRWDLDKLSDQFEKNDNFNSNLKSYVDELRTSIENHKFEMKELFKNFKEGLLLQFKQQDQNLYMKLETNKKEILGTPSAMVSVKDEVMKNFEAVALQADNAYSKAGNVEMLMKLLEKKLESLVLRVQKNELSK